MNNNKQKNSRIIDYSIGIEIDAKANLIFNNQEDVFSLFKSKTRPNSHGAYPIKDTNYYLWFPNLYGTDDEWNNEISLDGTEIFQSPKKGNDKNFNLKKGNLALVFGKYKKHFRFFGVFMEMNIEGKKLKYKKISDTIILNNK